MKITHPCALTAQLGKGLVLLSTNKYNRTKKNSVEMLSIIRHKSDKNDDVSNHLTCKHIHSSHICKVNDMVKVFRKKKHYCCLIPLLDYK
jgi:hypothetical protein